MKIKHENVITAFLVIGILGMLTIMILGAVLWAIEK
jgi:hypothetical protein